MAISKYTVILIYSLALIGFTCMGADITDDSDLDPVLLRDLSNRRFIMVAVSTLALLNNLLISICAWTLPTAKSVCLHFSRAFIALVLTALFGDSMVKLNQDVSNLAYTMTNHYTYETSKFAVNIACRVARYRIMQLCDREERQVRDLLQASDLDVSTDQLIWRSIKINQIRKQANGEISEHLGHIGGNLRNVAKRAANAISLKVRWPVVVVFGVFVAVAAKIVMHIFAAAVDPVILTTLIVLTNLLFVFISGTNAGRDYGETSTINIQGHGSCQEIEPDCTIAEDSDNEFEPDPGFFDDADEFEPDPSFAHDSDSDFEADPSFSKEDDMPNVKHQPMPDKDQIVNYDSCNSTTGQIISLDPRVQVPETMSWFQRLQAIWVMPDAANVILQLIARQ